MNVDIHRQTTFYFPSSRTRWKKRRVRGCVRLRGSPVHRRGLGSLRLGGSRHRSVGGVRTPAPTQALSSVFSPAGAAPHPQTQQQQQWLGAQRHHLPASSLRQLLLPPLREGERGLRPPGLHRPGNGAPEPGQRLLQSLN